MKGAKCSSHILTLTSLHHPQNKRSSGDNHKNSPHKTVGGYDVKKKGRYCTPLGSTNHDAASGDGKPDDNGDLVCACIELRLKPLPSSKQK